MKVLTLIALALSTLLVFSSAQANTFGENTRKKWDDWPVIPPPLDRVGTLKHPSGTRCTASYIGKKYLLTAAHCVMQKGKNKLERGNYLFEHIQLPNGKHWDSRKITAFHYVELRHLEDGGKDATKNHWVILEMNHALERPNSYFGYSYPGDDDYSEYHSSNYDLSIIGHSPSFNEKTNQLTYSDSDCEIKEHVLNGYAAYHDCDVGLRDSGSPLYQCKGNKGNWSDCRIVAIHIGAYSKRGTSFSRYSRLNANMATTMKSFKGAFYYLRTGKDKPSNLITVQNNTVDVSYEKPKPKLKQQLSNFCQNFIDSAKQEKQDIDHSDDELKEWSIGLKKDERKLDRLEREYESAGDYLRSIRYSGGQFEIIGAKESFRKAKNRYNNFYDEADDWRIDYNRALKKHNRTLKKFNKNLKRCKK